MTDYAKGWDAAMVEAMRVCGVVHEYYHEKEGTLAASTCAARIRSLRELGTEEPPEEPDQFVSLTDIYGTIITDAPRLKGLLAAVKMAHHTLSNGPDSGQAHGVLALALELFGEES